MALPLTSTRKSLLIIALALLNEIMKSLGFTGTTYGAVGSVYRGNNEINTATLPAGKHEKRHRKRKQHPSEEKSKTRESSLSDKSKQQREERALATRNRDGKDMDRRRVDYYAVKAWRSKSSGTSLSSGGRGKRTGISWWLDEIRSSGMDTLGEFDAWWRNNSTPHDMIDKMQMWDDKQLKEALTERGLDNSGKREECERRLKAALLRYSMGDNGMRHTSVDRSDSRGYESIHHI